MAIGQVLESETTLVEDEAVIERGMHSFVDVGEALARIRDARKYVPEFDSFEDYCKTRWGMSYSHARTHILAAATSGMLEVHGLPAPPTLRAAMPLVRLMNEKGWYDASTKALRKPEAGERAVVAAMTKVVRARERDPERAALPITGREVSAAIRSPANSRGEPGWLELVGKIGDNLIAAAKGMDKLEAALTHESKAVADKATQYAEWAEALARRLRDIEEP